MPDVFSKIEKIASGHKHDYPVSLENILLCMHAFLINRTKIPRMCIKQDSDWFDLYAQQCLFSNIEATEQWTLANLKLVHFPTKEIRQSNSSSKHECLELIEDLLRAVIGDSQIYYEKSRFSPFVEQDILQLINPLGSDYSSDRQFVYDRLIERRKYMLEYQKKHQNTLQALNLYGKTAIYHATCKFKIEEAWQIHWLHETRYQNPNIIDSILVAGEFDG